MPGGVGCRGWPPLCPGVTLPGGGTFSKPAGSVTPPAREASHSARTAPAAPPPSGQGPGVREARSAWSARLRMQAAPNRAGFGPATSLAPILFLRDRNLARPCLCARRSRPHPCGVWGGTKAPASRPNFLPTLHPTGAIASNTCIPGQVHNPHAATTASFICPGPCPAHPGTSPVPGRSVLSLAGSPSRHAQPGGPGLHPSPQGRAVRCRRLARHQERPAAQQPVTGPPRAERVMEFRPCSPIPGGKSVHSFGGER